MSSGATFEVTADVTSALAQIAKFTKTSAESLEGLKTLGEAFGLFKVAEIAVEAVKKFAEVIEESIEPAAKMDDSILRLSTTMKLAGNYSEEAAGHFEELAEQLSHTTRFSAQQAISAFALAEKLGITNAAAEKLVKTAADLASVEGTDLATATEKLSKTYTGTARELGRTIPGVKALTAAQLESGAAIDLISDKFHGAAEAMTGTFSGAVQLSKNQFEGMMETIGQFITRNPVVIALIKELGKAFGGVAEFLKENKTQITKFITDGLVALVSFAPTVVEVLQTVAKVVAGVTKLLALAAAGALSLVQGLLSINAVNDGLRFLMKMLIAITAGFLEIIKVVTDLPGVSTVLKTMGIDAQALGKHLEDAQSNLSGYYSEVATNENFARDAIAKAQDGVFSSIEATDKVLGSVNVKLDVLKTGAEKVASAIKKVAENTGDVLKTAVNAMEDQGKKLLELSKEQSRILTGGASKNPFAGLIGSFSGIDPLKRANFLEGQGIKANIDPATGQLVQGSERALLAGSGAGLLSNVLQGQKGAMNLFGDVAKMVGDAILPGLGPVFGQIIGILAQGPDQVKAMITQFADAIPDIMNNIIDSLPAIVEALGDKLTDPNFIAKMGHAMIHAMTLGADRFVGKLLEGAPNFVGRILEGANSFVGKILEGAGQFIQKLLDGIGKLGDNLNPFKGGGGLGDIGKQIPGGNGTLIGMPGINIGGNNGVGINVGGGHASVDLGPVHIGFKGGTGASGAAQGGEDGQPLVINLMLGQDQLAQTIYNLKRRGYRF